MLLKLCWKNIIFVIIIANGNMNDIEEILTEIRRFNQDRDWDQFHSLSCGSHRKTFPLKRYAKNSQAC